MWQFADEMVKRNRSHKMFDLFTSYAPNLQSTLAAFQSSANSALILDFKTILTWDFTIIHSSILSFYDFISDIYLTQFRSTSLLNI